MFSIDTAISYLVHKKFGFLAVTTPILADLDKDKTSKAHQDLAKIEACKAKLRTMPVKELEQLYLDAKKQDASNEALIESERFYNLAKSTAEFVHWSKAAHWSIDEAIALSFGREPDLVSWAKIEPYKDKSPFVKAYAKRHDLALRATRVKKLSDPVMPVVFISWAKELHIELPNELLSELEKVGNTAIDWRKEWQKLKANYDVLQTVAKHSNLGNTQKTENLLKAFACIAIDAYGYDTKSQKSTTTNDILRALKSQGKTLDPKTIRAWLKEGLELLPSKPL